MAKVITIANNKGGVGKTTTAVNMGASLRLHGFDVLLIDYDGQRNLTETLRVQVPTQGTIYDAIKTPSRHVTPVRLLSVDGKAGVLDVLPASRDLSALETELARASDRVTRLSAIIDTYRDWYDVILIDTPPTLGLLSVSALFASDGAIVTAQPNYLAVRGLVTLDETIKTIAGNRGRALPYSILFTQADQRKSLHRLIIDQVQSSGFDTMGTVIRDNIALAEAPATGTDIFRYKPRSNGARDYEAATAEYIAKSKLKHTKHGYK